MQYFYYFYFIWFANILVLVHYQTAVSHRISSVLRECSYIKSISLTPSLWKTVTVGKTFLPALS